MGSKYEVKVWVLSPIDGDYYYRQDYYGDSILRAVWCMILAKYNGVGCICLEWR